MEVRITHIGGPTVLIEIRWLRIGVATEFAV